jgi:succinyl-diaminopimelate desuccinylase
MTDIKKEVMELTKQLITFKSTKENPAELEKCLNFCVNYLKKYGIVKKFEFKGKPSLVATYGKTSPDIFLVGHLDVVEAPDKQFTAKIEGNKLLGRGAADMKGGDAIAMVLFKELAKQKPSLGVMLTSDEEVSGENGAGKLVKIYRCKFAIAPEPNSTGSSKQLNITVKHKGVLWLKIKAKGKAAHGSQPWLGDNAIDKLIIAYERIKEKFYEVKPNMWEPTINLGIISGGEAPNKIPDYAEAIVDVRWNEDFDKDKFLDEVKKLGVDFEIVDYSPMLDNDENNKYIKLLQKCVERVGVNCELVKEFGATDMRFFSLKKIPAVSFGPYGEEYHGLGEYLDINSIEPTYSALKEFVLAC